MNKKLTVKLSGPYSPGEEPVNELIRSLGKNLKGLGVKFNAEDVLVNPSGESSCKLQFVTDCPDGKDCAEVIKAIKSVCSKENFTCDSCGNPEATGDKAKHKDLDKIADPKMREDAEEFENAYDKVFKRKKNESFDTSIGINMRLLLEGAEDYDPSKDSSDCQTDSHSYDYY